MNFKLTGNAEIDQQHAVLNALIDRIEFVCERLTEDLDPSCETCNAGRLGACRSALAGLGDEILSFLVGHATYEERLMELLPDIMRCRAHISGHKEAHADIADQLRELTTRVGHEAPRDIGTQFHRLAKDWMGSHASQYDMPLAQQVEGLGSAEIEFDKELVAILDELVFHHRPTGPVPLHRRHCHASEARRDEVRIRLETLTSKQRDVSRLAVKGLANKQIAKQLGITINTVKTHRAEIFRKMNVSSLLDLVRAMEFVELKDF